MTDTLNIGSSKAVLVTADNTNRKTVLNHGGTVYYGSDTVTSASNDGEVADGDSVTLTTSKYFISASSSQLVIQDVSDEALSGTQTVGGNLTVAGTAAVTGAITGASTLGITGGITGASTDGLILSGNGGKDTLAISNTTANNGLTIGADTNLYRSAANTLFTDDALTVTGATILSSTLAVTGAVTAASTDGLVLSGNGGKDTLALSDTTADVGITIGADTNLYRSAANSLKTDDALIAASTLAVTGATTLSSTLGAGATTLASAVVTGTTTPTGGIVPISTTPRIHAGPTPTSLTFGTDNTPVATETYFAEIHVPANVTLTGIKILVGSVGGTDSAVVALFDSAGVPVANSALAGTTVGTTATWQSIAFTSTYAAKGPGQYLVGLQVNGTTARFRSIPAGPQIATGKKTAETFGTLTTITVPSTFTADLGPVAATY